MSRPLLATLLLTLALPLAAADVRELTWSELIPPDAPPQVINPAPIHDLSQLADALAESGPIWAVLVIVGVMVINVGSFDDSSFRIRRRSLRTSARVSPKCRARATRCRWPTARCR